MAQLITIPNHGDVEFPDNMSDDDIATAIRKMQSPDLGASEENTIGRAVGENIRGGITAAGDLIAGIPGMIGAAPFAAYEAITKGPGAGLQAFGEISNEMNPLSEDFTYGKLPGVEALRQDRESGAYHNIMKPFEMMQQGYGNIAGGIAYGLGASPETIEKAGQTGELGFGLGMAFTAPLEMGHSIAKGQRLSAETKYNKMVKEAEDLQRQIETQKQQEFTQQAQQGELFQDERVQPDLQTPYNLTPDRIVQLERELNPPVEQRIGGQGELFNPEYARDEILMGEGGRGARDQLPRPGLEFRDAPKLTEQEYFGTRENLLDTQRDQQGQLPLEPVLPKTTEEVTGQPGFQRDAIEMMQARETQRLLDQLNQPKEVGATNYQPQNFNHELYSAMDRVSEGLTPGGTRDLLNIIANKSEIPYYKELARLLLDDPKFNPRFEISDRLDLKDWSGEYSPTRYKVTINPKVQGHESTFLHEAVHARTHTALELQKLGAGTRSANRINELYTAFKNLTKDLPAGKSYGLESVHEFVAEGFTNPIFQADLARMPLPRQLRTSTMRFYWDKFVESIGKLLGFDKTKYNFLSELIKSGADVMHGLDSTNRQIFSKPNLSPELGQLGTPIGAKFSDFQKDLKTRGINIPDEAMRAIFKEQKYEGVAKQPAHPAEPVIKTIKQIPGLEKLQQQYVDTRTIEQLREDLKTSKDVTFAHANVVSKIIHGKFTATDHPLWSWVSSKVHWEKNNAIKKANDWLHGESKKNPSPGTYNYQWKKLTTSDRLDLNKVGQALNNSEKLLNDASIQAKAREILGRELSPDQLKAYHDRVEINKKVLTDINKFLTSQEPPRPAINELPHYWSPNEFKGPFLLRFKDTAGETRKIVSSYLKPDIKKFQKQFPEYKVDVVEKGMREEFDWDQFEWVLRQLTQEMRDPAAKAISEGLVRSGFSRHGLKRRGVEGGLGTEEGKIGLRNYEETSEKYIRGIYEYLSNRNLDRLYQTVNESMSELANQPNAKGFALEAIDTARGGSNVTFDKLSNALSEVVRGIVRIGTLDKVQLPRTFLHDTLQQGNKIFTTLLLGFLMPTNIVAQLLQAPTYTLPKLFELGTKAGLNSAQIMAAISKAGLNSMKEYAKWNKSLDSQKLQQLGTFDATFRYDWSTYASKTDPHYRQTMSDHLTGLSTLSWLESNAVRRPASLAILQILREIGYDKIAKTPDEIYRVAKEMTDQYMVSVKWYEKPHMFSRSGLVGTALSPLQSFATTWLGMLREYMKTSGEGIKEVSLAKQLPLASFLAVNLLTAGMLGMVGVKEWDVLANFVNKYFGFNIPTGTEFILSKVKNPTLAFGALSNLVGYHIGATFNAPTLTGSFAPGMQAIGNAANLGYQGVKSTGVFGELNKPTNVEMRDALKGVAPRFNVIPGIGQGDIEKSFTPPGQPYQSTKGTAGPYTRTEEDWKARRFGTYTLQESKEKSIAYSAQRDVQHRTARFSKAMNRIGDILLTSGHDPLKEIEPVIQALEDDHFSGQDISTGIKKELYSRLVESDVRALGKGTGSRQAYIAQLLQKMR